MYKSHSEAETMDFARKAGNKLRLPSMVCLYGDLGTGKTVFAKGLAESVGIPASGIKSPTFTFQRRHMSKNANFYHFDFYRVREADDLIRKDLEEALSDKRGLVVAEWAENVAEALPAKRIDVKCEYVDENTRSYTLLHTIKPRL